MAQKDLLEVRTQWTPEWRLESTHFALKAERSIHSATAARQCQIRKMSRDSVLQWTRSIMNESFNHNIYTFTTLQRARDIRHRHTPQSNATSLKILNNYIPFRPKMPIAIATQLLTSNSLSSFRKAIARCHANIYKVQQFEKISDSENWWTLLKLGFL